jgi:hypothetical protein
MTDLSPAAQAIKNAVLALDPDRKTFKWVWSLCRPIAAAALHAVADQVVPENQFGPPENAAAAQREITRAKLLAIATELKGQ